MNKLFIVFEGGEGAGKTSAIVPIQNWLRDLNYEVISTREPGGIKISEDIRKIILNKDNTLMDSKTEALLYAAARRQHLTEKVIPALNAGKIVLCDRFLDSSLVYQGIARNIGLDEVLSINQFAIDNYTPTLSILFDIRPEVGFSRIHVNSKREVNRLDLEQLDFHQKVHDGYLSIYNNPYNLIGSDGRVKINAEMPMESVVETLKSIILSIL